MTTEDCLATADVFGNTGKAAFFLRMTTEDSLATADVFGNTEKLPSF